MKNTMMRLALTAVCLAGMALAQSSTQLVTPRSVEPVAVAPGTSGTVQFSFKVTNGYHVNSNKPLSEFLIPTSMKVSPPQGISVTNLEYPQGQQMTFPFSPDEKVSVYAGDVVVKGVVRAAKDATPGTFRVHSELKYQACDNRQCFPPKTIPMDFDVQVVRKAKPISRTYTPASPHIR